jgi:hypothetical protein
MGSGAKSYIYDRRPPRIWLNISAFPHTLGRPFSYMNFLTYEENLVFLFYQ